MFWLSRRRYSEPLHKIWAKYFISTQIKPSYINCFDSDFIELINTISKDEVQKTEMYALNDNDKRDNQQYLIDILQLNKQIDDNQLKFMKTSLGIFQKNDSKDVKQLNNINHLFIRIIIRFIHLFTSQIEQNISPIPDSEDLSQQYPAIINIAFFIFTHFENDLFILMKQFFHCLLTNSEFIMTNDILRSFTCTIFHQSLQFIQNSPFSIDFQVFIFTVIIRYFGLLKNQMAKTDLLNDEVENMKQTINFISDNFKIISQKFSNQLTTFSENIFQIYSIFPLKNCELYYSLGFCSFNFFKNCLKINSSYISNNYSSFLNSIFFLIWSIDNFPIQNFSEPKLQFTQNFNSSVHNLNQYLNCELIDSPPLFTTNENENFKEEEISEKFIQNVPIEVLNAFNLFTELIISMNNEAFQTGIFECVSKTLINSIENGSLTKKANHDFDTILFYASFLISYLGLKLPLKTPDYCHFVILFNKMFYTDDEHNYSYHSYFRFFIYKLFGKIYDFDPVLVIDGFQQVLNNSQFHICDEIFLFFSHLLKLNSTSLIENISLNFYPRYFFLLQKFNENRKIVVNFIRDIFCYNEGRTKFLSDIEFVHSIFNFLFSKQTRDDVSNFILSAYEKENDLNCFNLAYKTFSEIFNHSKLPEKEWIDFFIHFIKLLKPILKKSRKLKNNSSEFLDLFESLENIFCSLKQKEERCLIAPFLNLITVFTGNNPFYRNRCLKFYNESLPIFENIVIDKIDDEIIIEIINHIYEYKIGSFSNPIFQELVFKNANAFLFLHNSTKNFVIHKEIFEKVQSTLHSDLANQTLLSKSDFSFIIIDFLRNSMNHPSFPVFLQLFDDVFSTNFNMKSFLHLSNPPQNSNIETQDNWKRYVFQIIEALSAQNEKDLSLKYVFLSGEKTGVSIFDQLTVPFEIKLNFFIRSYSKHRSDLISIFSNTKQASDLFRINMDKEGKVSIIYMSHLSTSKAKPLLVYNIETDIQIPIKKNIELTINFINNQINFHFNDGNEERLYEVKCQIPDFLYQKVVQISLFNSASKFKKHSICAFLFYFSLTHNKSNNSKTQYCLNLDPQYSSSTHMNKISDFEINGIVKSHATNVFTFMKNEGGTYILLDMIDNSILFLHFIHIISNLMHNNEKFENYFFKYIFQFGYIGIQKLDLNCWNQTTIKSFSKLTLSLIDKDHSEFLLHNIWLNFNRIWLKLEDQNIQHFTFSEILPKFFTKFEDFFKNKTNSLVYLSALQKSLENADNEIIMNDLSNILFFYLKNGFKENDSEPLKSFIFNSEKIKLRIQFNLRLFGIIEFDSLKTISLLDMFDANDQYNFFILFLNDLSLIDRNYISTFITEESFNILANDFINNQEMQNIFFDLIIVCSEFVSSEILLNFISNITSDHLITKIMSPNNLQLRTMLLVFIQFHSSKEESYDINKNEILIKFYSNLLSKDSSYIKNFFLVTLSMSNTYHYDCNPLFRSIFISILSQSSKIENIDLLLFYAFCFIFYLPKNDYYYNNISLYNSFEEEQYHLHNENLPELKQISLFEFIKIHQINNYQSLFPYHFGLRLDEEGKWIDNDLSFSLISHFKSKERLNYKFNFTKNQSICGIQIVSTLFIFLIKYKEAYIWDLVSFFLQTYPTFGSENETYEKSSIESLCYSMIPMLKGNKHFENSYRVFCNRFSICFEKVIDTISNEDYLLDSMKAEEIELIINSFGEVYHYQLLLLNNFGIYLSLSSKEFLNNFDSFTKSLKEIPKYEKISLFNSDEFIDSYANEFQYINNLNNIKITNQEEEQEKHYLFFNDSFHPIFFSYFEMKFIQYEDQLESKIIQHINIITLHNKISSFFIQKKDIICIGGYLTSIESIKFAFQRSPKQIEFFFKKGGLMLLIEFDYNLEDSFVNQFPTLYEENLIEEWANNQMNNYDFLLRLNFLNGRSFNDLDNYIIFPRVLKNLKFHSNSVKEDSFRDFQTIFKPIEKNEINEIHQRINILNSIKEERCELIPELYSMSEITSTSFIKNHILYLESSFVSSEINSWINIEFDLKLSKKCHKEEYDNKREFEIIPISKIVFNPFDSFEGSFYSISNDDQVVISKFKKGMLVHFKVPFEQSIQLKHSTLFALPKNKSIILYKKNSTGFNIFSYETSLMKEKEKFINSTLIERIGRINEDKYYMISSNQRINIFEVNEKIYCNFEGNDVITAYCNSFLNLTMILFLDGRCIFISNERLINEKSFKIKQQGIKWCILDNQSNSIIASETEIISYDINGRILASTKSNRKLTNIYHLNIDNEDFIAISTEKPNLFIVKSETLESAYTIRTPNPVVSFVFDYHTKIGIIYDNLSTYFVTF